MIWSSWAKYSWYRLLFILGVKCSLLTHKRKRLIDLTCITRSDGFSYVWAEHSKVKLTWLKKKQVKKI